MISSEGKLKLCDKIDIWTHTTFHGINGPQQMETQTVTVHFDGKAYRFSKAAFCSLVGCSDLDLGLPDAYKAQFNEWATKLIHAALTMSAD